MFRRVLCAILGFMLLAMGLVLTVSGIMSAEGIKGILWHVWNSLLGFFISWLLLYFAYKGKLPDYFTQEVFKKKDRS